MERRGITPEAAFAVLTEHSQRVSRKLTAVARELCETGQIV